MYSELNKKGILSQKNSNYAHDTNRNQIFGGSSSGWSSDRYYILKNIL